MAISKEKKNAVVAKLEKAIGGGESLVFVNFHGLSVADTTALRRALKAENVGYTVAKKSLIRRALAEKKLTGELPKLAGEIALTYLNEQRENADFIAPARGIHEFKKKNKNAGLEIVGGIFEGAYKTKEEMTTIAAIPSLHVLRGMFVNVINAPIQGLAVALSEMAGKKA